MTNMFSFGANFVPFCFTELTLNFAIDINVKSPETRTKYVLPN